MQVRGFLTIITSALLRPSQFIAFLDQSNRAIARAGVATIVWIGFLLGLLSLLFTYWLLLDSRVVLASVLMAPLFVNMLCGLGAMAGVRQKVKTRTGIAFWILRSQIALTPLFTILVSLVLTLEINDPARLWLRGYTFLIAVGVLNMLGAAVAGLITLKANEYPNWAKARRRWLIAGMALIVFFEIRWIPVLTNSEVGLLLPFLTGLGFGMLRLLSWIWESVWSMMLLVAHRLGMDWHTLRNMHPVSFDKLSVLPLPGLTSLLVAACRADLEAGLAWLAEVEQHPGQRSAAQRAVRRMLADEHLAHRLLLTMSVSSRYTALLQTLSQQLHNAPLLRIYAELSTVAEPGAWPAVAQRTRRRLRAQCTQATCQDLVMLLDLGHAVLAAPDWRQIVQIEPWLSREGASALARSATELIQLYLAGDTPDFMVVQSDVRRLLPVTELAADSWPLRLFAAMSEQLLFLRRIEHKEIYSLNEIR